MSRRERGQSIVEYLAVSLTIILAILGLTGLGLLQTMADRLMGIHGGVEYQLKRTDHSTVDSFLTP